MSVRSSTELADTLVLSADSKDLHDSERWFPESRALRVNRAMTDRLRDEVVRSRRMNAYGTISEEYFPEVADDKWVIDQQEAAAESAILSSLETAFDVAFLGGRASKHITLRPMIAEHGHGVDVDTTPAWAYDIKSRHSGMRFEVPFIPTKAVRLHAWRDLKGTDRNAHRIGGGVSLDPFDEEIRLGFTFQF